MSKSHYYKIRRTHYKILDGLAYSWDDHIKKWIYFCEKRHAYGYWQTMNKGRKMSKLEILIVCGKEATKE